MGRQRSAIFTAEYVETESKKRSNAAALEHAKAIGATVVFAKLRQVKNILPARRLHRAHACTDDARQESRGRLRDTA
jgi:hypothetical protein